MAINNNGSSVGWFLVGAAIGAAIALLYAPQSGERTRRLIGKKAGEGRDTLADRGKEILDRGKEYYDKGRRVAEEVGEVFERGRKRVTG
jgi:gas vesicle protein